MIACKAFYDEVHSHGISFFAGVPDSLLKDFCAYITAHTPPQRHIIAANEGGAVALAAGHYLATGNPGLVYMQNSGQGNAVNPLTSLADPDVYGMPMLLVIGWRGEPGTKDEPQHVKQGAITLALLDTLGIQYQILPDNMADLRKCMQTAMHAIQSKQMPYALVVKKDTFEPYRQPILQQASAPSTLALTREDAIQALVALLDSDDIVVSTTGKTSRELFECRMAAAQKSMAQDFLTVGSMGHASQIALGIALAKPARRVYCFDGDGALIMHMGALAIIGTQPSSNFKHIVLNNGAHDSVGGQPTAGFEIDIPSIALACGYKVALSAETLAELRLQFRTVAEV